MKCMVFLFKSRQLCALFQEGLAIAVPIFAATGSRWRAFGMSLASGLSEPLGACLGLLALKSFGTLTHSVVENATCAVGGIMVAVSMLELGPESRKHNEPAAALAGFLLGWVVMSLTVGYA